MRFLSILLIYARPYSEIFCPLLPHRPYSPSLSPLPLPIRRESPHNKPVDFSPTTPYIPCMREAAHRCVRRRVNVRPSPHATDRRASYAPTHRSLVCFGFPGVTRAPHFSPRCDSDLSVSLSFSFSQTPSFSLSYSLVPCACISSPCLYFAARCIPHVRETHRRVERRRGPEMGIDSESR